MGVVEILIIVFSGLVVVGTIVGAVIRKKKKGTSACCGDCHSCSYCPSDYKKDKK